MLFYASDFLRSLLLLFLGMVDVKKALFFLSMFLKEGSLAGLSSPRPLLPLIDFKGLGSRFSIDGVRSTFLRLLPPPELNYSF